MPSESAALDRSVEIPAGDLAGSLEELSRQLGIQILFDADRLDGIRAPAISGGLTAREALDKLLLGTSLRLQEQEGDSFLVTPALPPTTRSAPATTYHVDANPQLEEVTVTGTHIRGEAPVGASFSNYDRSDFDTLGIATVDELSRSMLENFSGAGSLAALNTNGHVGNMQQGASNNIFGGSGFDLLGLGPGATLTLLNGHRIAPGGLDGSMADVSLIPLSAIDHIEVLTDGASAIYGSDAVAGVVNMVTRRNLEGAESSVRYGQSTEGGAGQFTASQLFGHSWTGGGMLLDYEYDDHQGLDASQRSWIASENGPYFLAPKDQRRSLFISLNQDFDDFQYSTTGLYSSREFREAGLTLNPSGVVPDSEIGGGHANLAWTAFSVDRDLPAAWHLNGSATYSRMAQWKSAQDYSDGLAGASFDSALETDTAIETLDAAATGNLFHLPGGNLRAALGSGLRVDSFRGSVPSIDPLPQVVASRTNLNAFAEVVIPLFGETFSFPGARRVEVSLAYRVDTYSHLGSRPNSKFGWTWEPIGGLTARGTLATSFVAPLILQLHEPITSYTALLPSDPVGGFTPDVLVLNGGSPTLFPETSRSFTSGIDWMPIQWPQIRGSITYYNVSYKNHIQSQNINDSALTSQPQLVPLTSLYPSVDEVLPWFSSSGFQRDGAGLGAAGVNAIIDNQLQNEGSTVEQGVRFDGQYLFPSTAFGSWKVSYSGRYLLVDDTSIQTYFVDLSLVANTVAEPTKFRMRGDLTWQKNSLTADLAVNRISGYRNTLLSPVQNVAPWTTEDLTFQASLPNFAYEPMRNVNCLVSVQNLTDRRPPFVSIPEADIAVGRSAVPFDGTNASAVGRYISIEVRKQW